MKRALLLLLALAAALGTAVFTLGAWHRSPYDQALRQAVRSGDQPAVRLLIRKGADPNTVTDLHLTVAEWALTHEQPGIAEDLLRAGARVVPDNHLCLAAEKGYASLVELLLERGANPNVRMRMATGRCCSRLTFQPSAFCSVIEPTSMQ